MENNINEIKQSSIDLERFIWRKEKIRILENNLESNYIKADGIKKTYSEVVAQNIKVSEQLRCDIYKENDIFRMLDLALLCVSTMTGDRVFYKQNRKKLVNFMCNWKSNR